MVSNPPKAILAEGIHHREAVERAVDECIRNDILAKILRKNRGEIVDSILTKWDEDEFREFLKEESWKKGHESGKELGKEQGMIVGTIRTCMEFQVSKEDTLAKIMKDFSLEEENAKSYIEEYWK